MNQSLKYAIIKIQMGDGDMQKKSETLLAEGREYAQGGNIPKAIECFEQAVFIAPDSIDARFTLGSVYNITNFFDRAKEQFEAVIKLDPLNREAHASCASCMLGKRFQEEMKLKNKEEFISEEARGLYRQVEEHSARAIELGDIESSTFLTHVLALAYLGKGEELYHQIMKHHRDWDNETKIDLADKVSRLGILYGHLKEESLVARWYLLATRELNPSNSIVKELDETLRLSDVPIENELTNIEDLCESEPDTALELLDSLEKSYTEIETEENGFIVKSLRMQAYGSKGLRQLIREKPWVDITTTTESELRDDLGLTNEHLDYLEKALIIFSSLEKNYLKFINYMSKEDLMATIDGPAMAIEKCRPGRVQQILGKTKLCYFGFDRLHTTKLLDISSSELKPFIYNNFFTSVFIARSAVITAMERDIKGRKYIVVALTEDTDWFKGKEISMDIIYLFDDGSFG